jgi:hypothetical protein
MASGLSNKLAGQIGEYLVCAELGRRDLIATPFSGNVPTFDVLATDELCRTVPIQVKASRGNQWPTDARHWMKLELENGIQNYTGPSKLQNPELIYVCVAIGKPGVRDRFFILAKADLQKVCVANYTGWMTTKNWRRPRNPASYDCRYDASNLAAFEDNWDLITNRLKGSAPDPSLASIDRAAGIYASTAGSTS